MTPIEIMETFPEALPIVNRNLAMWRKYRREAEPVYEELFDAGLRAIYEEGKWDDGIKDKQANRWYRKIYETDNGIWKFTERYFPMTIDKHISRLDHLKRLYEMRNEVIPAGEITDRDIEVAKGMPITDYVEVTTSGFARCPFHDDRRPSAKWYRDNNKVHCFVCSRSFDVIDVVMKMRGVDFLDAVKIILGR